MPTVPILPAYTQLFREDGSRLADEGEDLPRYPGQKDQHAPPPSSRRGTISGPSPRPDGLPAGDAHWSMIAASEILDDSIDPAHAHDLDAAARENAQEYEEASTMDERVDLDADLPDEERAHDVEDFEDSVAVTPIFDTGDGNSLWGPR